MFNTYPTNFQKETFDDYRKPLFLYFLSCFKYDLEKRRMKKMKKIRFYFDSDGTLFEWDTHASIEEVSSKGYFADRIPQQNVIDALKLLREDDVELNILSAVFTDGHSINDKISCFKKHGLENVHSIFVPYGENKSDYIHHSDKFLNILIDDYTPNCMAWSDGIAVKIYNGINGTKGRWHGYQISSDMSPLQIRNTLLGIAMCEM